MKKIISLILTLCLMATLCAAFASCATTNENGENNTSGDTTKKTYKVGICQLVQHDALDAATKGFIDTLKAELGEENVEFYNENASGETSTCTTIINNFVSKKVDLIMANATPALQAAVAGTSDIPILGTSITEYGVALELDNFDGLIGSNVSGTSDLAPLDEQAKMITDLIPEAEKVALLYCSAEPNSEYQVKEIRRLLVEGGIEDANIKDYKFTDSNDVATVSAAAAAFADVIYIPTDNTAASCTETINGQIGDTPVIAGESGICGGCGVATLSIDYYDLGVATAKMAAKILKGEAKVEEMRIEYAAQATKKYNADKCAQLGIDIEALKALGYVALG